MIAAFRFYFGCWRGRHYRFVCITRRDLKSNGRFINRFEARREMNENKSHIKVTWPMPSHLLTLNQIDNKQTI